MPPPPHTHHHYRRRSEFASPALSDADLWLSTSVLSRLLHTHTGGRQAHAHAKQGEIRVCVTPSTRLYTTTPPASLRACVRGHAVTHARPTPGSRALCCFTAHIRYQELFFTVFTISHPEDPGA